MKENMEISFPPKKKSQAKTELSLEVAKIICHFYVEIHENLSAYYSKRSIFQDSKNNLTLLEIYIISTRSMKKYGSRGLKKNNHKMKSYFRKFRIFLSNKSYFYSNFSHETQHFFNKSRKLFDFKVT